MDLPSNIFHRRFFIGRNSDPAAALQQFKDSLSARKQVNDIATYSNIDVKIYEQTRKMVLPPFPPSLII